MNINRFEIDNNKIVNIGFFLFNNFMIFDLCYLNG